MATFEAQVESLTKLTIAASSTVPTQDELNQFLEDGARDVVRKVTVSGNANILDTFATKKSLTGSSTSVGDNIILSVTRGDGSIQNPARQIDRSLSGRATDVDSLFYASKYNPVYYVEAGSCFILPVPTSGSNDGGEVLCIQYDTGVNCTESDIDYFPEASYYIIVLYAAAMACFQKSSDIHNNLPTIPTFTTSPGFSYEGVDLPTLPTYTPPSLEFDISSTNTRLSNDDPEMADKELEIVSKHLNKYGDDMANAANTYKKELDIFTKDLERRAQNSDQDVKNQINQFGADIRKYEMELNKYQSQINEEMAEYGWYTTRYASLMNQYTSSVLSLLGGTPKPQEVPTQGRERRGEK